jgi:hypothetical protein
MSAVCTALAPLGAPDFAPADLIVRTLDQSAEAHTSEADPRQGTWWHKLGIANPCLAAACSSERVAQSDREISLIAFSRGLLLGFFGALAVFDQVMMNGATSCTLIGSMRYLIAHSG